MELAELHDEDSGARGGRLRVETHGVALRVGELRRGGVLRPNAEGTLTWGTPARPLAGVSFSTTRYDLEISYFVGERAAESVVERISLARVRAGFGGMRTYFRCPGEGCNRGVEVLHLAKGRFRCRRCHGLVYESQYEDTDHRRYRRANKLRGRLRYERLRPYYYAPVVRPKGMWRRKLWRLQDEIDEADLNATAACAMRFCALAAKICRSRKRGPKGAGRREGCDRGGRKIVERG